MPSKYAKRFADLIASDPDVASDYTVQLYDPQFATEVASELKKMGFEADVALSGLLTVHVPDDHPQARARQEKKSLFDIKWPRKPEDRTHCQGLPVAI